MTNLDGSYWVYGYDSMGQVTSGKKYWSDGTPVAGQQFDYAFDDIGNRQTTTRDGRQATYTPNSLNQYTSRTVPGFVNVLGTATNTATVSLWSQDNLALYTPTTRKGDYFRGEMLVNNNTGALWLTITNVAVLSNYTGADIVTNIAGSLLLAQNPETFIYDADGNLTSDGRWTYTWDGENRLVKQESLGGAPTASKLKLEFQYDSQGRRIQKLVSTNNGSIYVAQYTNRFVYDGWNLLAILDLQSSILYSFMWGLDLSGTLQDAGGVGGLLAITDASQGSHFCAYDGNGNVSALVKADGSGLTAQYEYGPFGELLRATGPMAKANPFRFSTKYQDDESDLLYYGYRYYNASTGGWPSRDPLGEKGSQNLYGFVRNGPISRIDSDGRADIEIPTICPRCGQSVNLLNGSCGCAPLSLPAPTPGSEGENAKRFGGYAYFCTSRCGSKKDHLSPIPGVSTPPNLPIQGCGPNAGTYGIYPFPTTPPSAVGSAGAGPCIILVVKCPEFVAVFHFTSGDSPGGTLRRFSWPSGCSSIMCGFNDDGDTNCRRKDVKSAANAAGLNVVGVSGNSGCGVDADGNWWQWGN